MVRWIIKSGFDYEGSNSLVGLKNIKKESNKMVKGNNQAKSGRWIPCVPNTVVRNLARCRRDCVGELKVMEASDLLKTTIKQVEELLACLGVGWENYNFHEEFED